MFNEIFFIIFTFIILVIGIVAANPIACFEPFLSPKLSRYVPHGFVNYINEHKRALTYAHNKIEARKKPKKKKVKKVPNKNQSAPISASVAVIKVWKEIIKRMQWKLVILCTIATLGCTAIDLLKPMYVGNIFDSIVMHDASMENVFWPFARKMTFFTFFEYLLMTIRDWASYGALHRFRKETRTNMLRNILSQDMDYLQQYRGGLKRAMEQESDRLNGLVNGSVITLCKGTLKFFGGIFTIMYVDWRLALVGMFLKAPIIIIIRNRALLDRAKYGLLYQESEGQANVLATQFLRSTQTIQLIQGHVAINSQVNKYEIKYDNFIHVLHLTHFRQTALCWTEHLIRRFEDLILMGLGFYLVISKNMSLGEYLTFRQHLNQYASGWGTLYGWFNGLRKVSLSASRYFELMYRKPSIPLDEGIRPQTQCKAQLNFQDVSFSYRINVNVPVLNNINLILAPGKVVALVGKSGGGKTTITRLLQRFYDPTGGKIMLDGKDLQNYNVNWLRSQVRVVDQDTYLFDTTVEDNISLGLATNDEMKEDMMSINDQQYDQDEYQEEEEETLFNPRKYSKEQKIQNKLIKNWRFHRVKEAAKIAQAHDFITKLEKGYQTKLGPGGIRLSGGQKQRVAIARALISRPAILALDEITAALDTETEVLVMENMFRQIRTMGRGVSVLVVAHRLSTIRHADEINVVVNGHIVERGSHTALMQKNGHYASLVNAAEKDTRI